MTYWAGHPGGYQFTLIYLHLKQVPDGSLGRRPVIRRGENHDEYKSSRDNKAATYLSDDFQFIGSTPRPLNKDQFIRVLSELAEGMPNISYHFHGLQEVDEKQGEGIRERATIQITGTQVNSFELVPLCFLKHSKTCVTMLQYLLQRASFHLTNEASAVHPPQAFFRADEATTGTPIALATGLHVLVL